ncbi:MAG: acetyl-CoA carboxylase biotin carboxyl carrier protein [Nitrospirae bacterium]|nr:acetyl-CoA carboxylase biotin carboxyl carrier protein [Nitrospirota bacterium]
MKDTGDSKPLKSVKKPWVDITELRSLIDLVKDTEVSELEVEKDGVRVKIKKSVPSASYGLKKLQETVSVTMPSGFANHGTSVHTADLSDDKYHAVTSPIVGTFYRSPSPDSEFYVNVGDTVKKGQILCIVEAMKLMNEIESEVDGKIAEILAEDSQPVEYGEVLFKIEPV